MCCFVKLKTHRSAIFIMQKMSHLKLLSLSGIGTNFCIKDSDFEQHVAAGSMVFERGFTHECERACKHHYEKQLLMQVPTTPSTTSSKQQKQQQQQYRTPPAASGSKWSDSSSPYAPRAPRSKSAAASADRCKAAGTKRLFSETGLAKEHKSGCNDGDDNAIDDDNDDDNDEGDLLAALDELDRQRHARSTAGSGAADDEEDDEAGTTADTGLASCSREQLESWVRGLRKLYRKGEGKLEKAERRAVDAEKRLRSLETSTAAMREGMVRARDHLLKLVSDLAGVKSPSVSVHSFRHSNMVYNHYKPKVGMGTDQQLVTSQAEGKGKSSSSNSRQSTAAVEKSAEKYIGGMYSKPRSALSISEIVHPR